MTRRKQDGKAAGGAREDAADERTPARAQGRGTGRRAADRGRYGRLSRERVLSTALELVDREGLSALSMRRLGAELGVEAMALYRYAAGKDGLLDGLVEALYLELHERLDAGFRPPAGPGAARKRGGPGADPAPPWRLELHRIAQATYQVALEHREVVPLLATRMLAVPLARRSQAVLRAQEDMLGLLAVAGLDEEEAAAAYRAVSAWTLGYVFADLQAMVDNPEEPEAAFRLGLHRMPVHDFPELRAVTPVLAENGGPQGLAEGLDAVLDRWAPG
ncbi:TetR/AcrR family transcriptional regulator [Actinacidiphila rubida]|uniref:Transcriptional regulator, TetR family n=1 Tax=Actinacidiphila rubida TaxID=310780 RepID=A0A1H8ST18_9ACTN|nr:TetR/AcrR family transcriptional regulator [Actinacidiphila rubida]SEO81504.1 transcriptional regulator, TetR family [Actinacidiphila rubida]